MERQDAAMLADFAAKVKAAQAEFEPPDWE
jgi:hypothetical protein